MVANTLKGDDHIDLCFFSLFFYYYYHQEKKKKKKATKQLIFFFSSGNAQFFACFFLCLTRIRTDFLQEGDHLMFV